MYTYTGWQICIGTTLRGCTRSWGHQIITFISKIMLTNYVTASNLLRAFLPQARIVSSSISSHTALRLRLRLSILLWSFSQAFHAKIPQSAKSTTLRSGNDGGQKHFGQNLRKLSWHHNWIMLEVSDVLTGWMQPLRCPNFLRLSTFCWPDTTPWPWRSWQCHMHWSCWQSFGNSYHFSSVLLWPLLTVGYGNDLAFCKGCLRATERSGT